MLVRDRAFALDRVYWPARWKSVLSSSPLTRIRHRAFIGRVCSDVSSQLIPGSISSNTMIGELRQMSRLLKCICSVQATTGPRRS